MVADSANCRKRNPPPSSPPSITKPPTKGKASGRSIKYPGRSQPDKDFFGWEGNGVIGYDYGMTTLDLWSDGDGHGKANNGSSLAG